MKTNNHLIYKAFKKDWKHSLMKPQSKAAALAVLIGLMTHLPNSHAEESCVRATDEAVISRFNRWNLALASMDPHTLANLYWNDAVLVSDAHHGEIAGSQALIEYFSDLMHSHPRARVDSRHVFNGCGFSIDVGRYTLSTLSDEGLTSDHPGVFSFVYLYRNGQWKILHQNLTPLNEETTESPESTHGSHHGDMPVEAHNTSHGGSNSHDNHTVATAHESSESKHESHAKATSPSHEKSVEQEPEHNARDGEHEAHDSNTKPIAKKKPHEGNAEAGTSSEGEAHSLEGASKAVPAYLLRTGENLSPTSFLKSEPASSPDTVGLKVCLSNGQTTAVVVDPSSLPGLNEAAIAWAQASHWTIAGGHDSTVCSHVVARFPAGKKTAGESAEGAEHKKSEHSAAKSSDVNHEATETAHHE